MGMMTLILFIAEHPVVLVVLLDKQIVRQDESKELANARKPLI